MSLKGRLYHGTPRFYLRSIQNFGLDPACSGAVWPDSERFVYLHADPREALRYGRGDPKQPYPLVALLAIDIAQLDPRKLAFDGRAKARNPDERGSFQYAGNIPADAIVEVEQPDLAKSA